MLVPRMARMAAVLLALVAVLALGATALAGDGDLDAGFGAGGVVLTPLGDDASGGQISIDNSGRYVVASTIAAGGVSQPALVRYAAGTPDLTFNTTGRQVLSGLPSGTADAVLARQIPANTGPAKIVVAGGQGTNWYVTRLSDTGAVDWTVTIPLPVSTVAAHVGGFTMDATGLMTIAGWGETSVGGAHGYLAQLDASGTQPAPPALTMVDAAGASATRLRAIASVGSDFYVVGSAKTGSVTKAYVGRRDGALGLGWEQQRAIGSGGDSTAYDVQSVSGAGPGYAVVVGQAAQSGARRAFVAEYAAVDGAAAFERLITAGNGGDAGASAVRISGSAATLSGSALQDGSRRAMVDRIRLDANGIDDPAFTSGPAGAAGPVLLGAGDGRSAQAVGLALDGAQPILAGTASNGGSSHAIMLARLSSVTQNPAVSFTHGNTHSDLTDYEGEPLTFTATATPGAGATISTYEWDFDGDGTFDATGQQPKHTYPAAGSYLAQLRVTDSNGVRTYASATIAVAANAGPSITALDVSPLHPGNGGTVTLCPKGTDPKGYSVSYEFDLDADGTFEKAWNGSGGCPEVFFDASGSKPATKTYAVRAIDFVGKHSATLTRTVQGITSAPAAGVVISDKSVVGVGQAITFVAQGFEDVDGVVSKWRFDLDGNGTWDTDWQAVPFVKSSFPTPRQAQVRAQGMDEDGEVSPATLGHGYTVVGPPTAKFKVVAAKTSTSKGRSGAGIHPLQKLSFDASASKPGPFAPFLAPVGFVSYFWDPQGDGSFISSTGAVLDGVSYANPGIYQAKLTICTAALSDQCTSAVQKVTIVNQAPQADFGLETGGQLVYKGKPFTVEAGRLAHFQATVAKDPDGPPHKIVSYEWDLDANAAVVSQPGARAASNGKNIPVKPSGVLPGKAALSSKAVAVATPPISAPAFELNAKGPGPTVKFLQASNGVYHVALRETDDSGGATTVVHPVKVTEPTPPLAHFDIDLQYSQDALGVPILRPGIPYPVHSDSKAAPSASKPGLTYEWSNGCKGDVEGCSVAFPKPGGYVIALTVTDADGVAAVYSQPVQVRANTAPFGTVKVTPAYPREGQPVHLDATGSTDDGKYFALDWGHFNDPVFVTDYDSQDFGLDVKLYEGHHDLALRLTDDEGEHSIVEVPIDVGPPVCQAAYASDHLDIAIDDASTGCIRVHEGTGGVTGKPETFVDVSGPFTVDGLHVDPAGTVQVYDFHNAVGNDKVTDKFNGTYKPGDKLPIIVAGSGQVRRGTFVVSDGPFGFAVRPDAGLDFLSYAAKVPQKLHGLEVVGITGQQIAAGNKIDFGINIKLPDEVGGATSDNTPFSAWSAENGGGGTRGAHLRDVGASTDCAGIPGAPPGATCITVDTGDLAGGALPLHKLQLAYGGNDVWIVRAEGSLPIPPNGANVAAGVQIEQGSFKHGDLSADFNAPGFPVAEAVNLTHVDFAIDLKDGFKFAGNANFAIGPSFDDAGDAVFGLNAHMTFSFPKEGYWSIGGGGDALLLGTHIADGSFLYSSSGYVEFGGSLDYNPTPATHFDAHVAGQYYDGQFNLSGGGQGCVLGWCEGGDGVISSKGIGVCIHVTINYLVGSTTWSPGFTVAYHPFDLNLFAHACDLSDVVAPIVKPTRRRSVFLRGAPGDLPVYAHAAGFSKTFDIGDNIPGAILTVVGSTAPPEVTLSGPKSRKIDGTAPGLVVKPMDYTLLHDPKTRTTYVVLLGPAKGKWTLTVPEGSSPVVSADLSPGLAQPSITADVVKSGGKYKLAYKVQSQPGLKVEFAERSGNAYASLGTVRPGVGSIPFTPAAGPKGKRQIVAILYAGSRPRSRDVVTTYEAPAPAGPQDVSGVNVAIKSGKATVNWDKAARASRYFVTVTLSDGRVIQASVTKTSLVVPGLDRGVDASATVRAFDAEGLRGDADKDKTTTPDLPGKLALGITKTVREIDKKQAAPAPGLTLLPSTKVPLP